MKFPRESAALIAKLSKDVSISEEGVQQAADWVEKGLLESEYDLSTWKKHDLFPKTVDASSVDWIFFVDTLNFSFWCEAGKAFSVSYKGKSYTGFWSLCAAVNRAIEEGYDLLNPKCYSKLSMEDMKNIFRSDTSVEMPILEERQRVLKETGEIILEKFGGSFTSCLSQCENSAMKLLKIIVDNFPSYRDVATINGHEVSLYKRAQILIGDIWACYEGKSFGLFHDIDSITMFADYRVPQVLLYLGVLKYSKELEDKLKQDTLLPNGDRLEVEIRGCTIWAVELICNEIQRRGKDKPNAPIANPIMVDNYLWDYRRDHVEEMKKFPFHKTRCIFY